MASGAVEVTGISTVFHTESCGDAMDTGRRTSTPRFLPWTQPSARIYPNAIPVKVPSHAITARGMPVTASGGQHSGMSFLPFFDLSNVLAVRKFTEPFFPIFMATHLSFVINSASCPASGIK